MWKSPDTDGIPPFVSLAILPQHRLAASFLASVPRSSSSTVRLFQVVSMLVRLVHGLRLAATGDGRQLWSLSLISDMSRRQQS